MKPRIFIGSSGSSRNIAEAILGRLDDVAECTVWTAGAFDVATTTLAGLQKHLHDSDFAIFVFAADDDAVVKGKLLKVPRDNVVYEAGLFSGHFSPERCFIAAPRSVEVHIPTDLAGMTLGFYNDQRIDDNDDAAVLTCSNQFKKRIQQLGLFKGSSSEELRDLVVRFECCQSWIKDEKERVETKKRIGGDIEGFCQHHLLNKHRLLVQRRTGYYLALLATIRFRPEDKDWELILKLDTGRLPPGFIYYKVMEAVEAIKASDRATPDQLKQLHDWLNSLADARKHIGPRIDSLIK